MLLFAAILKKRRLFLWLAQAFLNTLLKRLYGVCLLYFGIHHVSTLDVWNFQGRNRGIVWSSLSHLLLLFSAPLVLEVQYSVEHKYNFALGLFEICLREWSLNPPVWSQIYSKLVFIHDVLACLDDTCTQNFFSKIGIWIVLELSNEPISLIKLICAGFGQPQLWLLEEFVEVDFF